MQTLRDRTTNTGLWWPVQKLARLVISETEPCFPLGRVPGHMVLINHLPPRTEWGKKPWAAAFFPRPAKSHLLFNLSNPP